MPSKLWDVLLIEDAEKAELRKLKKANSEETTEHNTMIFAPIAVELVEKNQDTLAHPRIKIEFSNGGGVVDFAKYRGGRAGTFYLKLDFEALREGIPFKIFYLSGGRIRKVDDMIVGTGCKSYFNITRSFIKDMSGLGIPLNSTRFLHSSAIGGHLLVSWLSDGQLNVTQVHFVDSEREDLLCPPLRGDLL